MTKFSMLRIGPGTEIIRDKNGDLSLIYKNVQYGAPDNIPPEALAYIIVCISRDYGDTRDWPELAREFISLCTANQEWEHHGKPTGDDPDRSSA